MNQTSFPWLSSSFLLLVAGMISITETLPAQQARDVTREETLRQQAGTAPTLKSYLQTKAKPLTNKPPAIQSSLWTHSIILSDGEKYTLVPVGSILHLPETLRSKVLTKPTGEFTFWPNFLQLNEAWLGAQEVSLKMSRGDAKEAKILLQRVAKDPRLLVATHQGGPITILEAAPAKSAPSPTQQ